MSVDLSQFRLGVSRPFSVEDDPSLFLSSWPPTTDFPVVVDRDGTVVSRYGDSRWDLTPWEGWKTHISFNDSPSNRLGVSRISKQNADVLRMITAWWIWGYRGARTANCLTRRVSAIKPIFTVCSMEGIDVRELADHPAVLDKVCLALGRIKKAPTTVRLLHDLLNRKHELGFVLFNKDAIRQLVILLNSKDRNLARQTPYIPPRIWTNLIGRLNEVFDDFEAHEENIMDCYKFCLGAYTHHGSNGPVLRARTAERGLSANRAILNPFNKTLMEFGLVELLEKWCASPLKSVRSLSNYLSMIARAGFIYILAFSMMRSREAWMLRYDCLSKEVDRELGAIFYLRGEACKTDIDSDAQWITSPTVERVIRVLQTISRIRRDVARLYPQMPKDEADLKNPPLFLRTYEPWEGDTNKLEKFGSRPSIPYFEQVLREYPKLFDLQALEINTADIEIARLVNPDLDNSIYACGVRWKFGWHQLRRTGAVNMQASGLVSDSSVQYQLKHATRAMSLYYGRGYSRLRINEVAYQEYITTMYEILGKEISALMSDRFVSPYGKTRKQQLLKLVSSKDTAALSSACRSGEVAWRLTLLGGCTKRGVCSYGGIDHIARCAGGDGKAPCIDAIFDRQKRTKLLEFLRILNQRIEISDVTSPDHESLLAQRRAVENTLNAISEDV